MDLVSESSTNEISSPNNSTSPTSTTPRSNKNGGAATSSRYESQKRRDWNTFCQYLQNHRPPLSVAMCGGANVLEFLHYLDQFGKTKVHNQPCPFFGLPNPPSPCPCPLRQAWGSLDALIGRLRAAYEENGGSPETNPFASRSVRVYLRDVRDFQSKSRGVSYEKKRKRPNRNNNNNPTTLTLTSASHPPPPASLLLHSNPRAAVPPFEAFNSARE